MASVFFEYFETDPNLIKGLNSQLNKGLNYAFKTQESLQFDVINIEFDVSYLELAIANLMLITSNCILLTSKKV